MLAEHFSSYNINYMSISSHIRVQPSVAENTSLALQLLSLAGG